MVSYTTGRQGDEGFRAVNSLAETPTLANAGLDLFCHLGLARRQPLLRPEERSLVVSAIRHFEGQRYELPAYVVMDDHVHVIAVPLGDFLLHRIVHSWKSFTAQRLVRDWGRRAPIWQREYFDRIVRDEAELVQKAEYILGNPIKRWPHEEQYPWCGLGCCP